jgi:hypothetical protein
MRIKRRLTEVAVDSFADYLKVRFAKLKELDLDDDGQKDVDQLIEIVNKCGHKLKDTMESTNFANLATGLDQIFTGLALIRGSIDQEKLAALTSELADGSKKLTVLGKLSVQRLKEAE